MLPLKLPIMMIRAPIKLRRRLLLELKIAVAADPPTAPIVAVDAKYAIEPDACNPIDCAGGYARLLCA